MNIFVVAQASARREDTSLIDGLARIEREPCRHTPVIVVDDPLLLATQGDSPGPADVTWLCMEDFGMTSDAQGVVADSIAKCIDRVSTDWLVIEFGQCDRPVCADFIVKLARYNYLSLQLRHRKLVFLAPVVYLGVLARTLNESFNNLPGNPASTGQAGQWRRLLLRVHLQRVLARLPLPPGLLHRVLGIARRLYQRLFRVNQHAG